MRNTFVTVFINVIHISLQCINKH